MEARKSLEQRMLTNLPQNSLQLMAEAHTLQSPSGCGGISRSAISVTHWKSKHAIELAVDRLVTKLLLGGIREALAAEGGPSGDVLRLLLGLHHGCGRKGLVHRAV